MGRKHTKSQGSKVNIYLSNRSKEQISFEKMVYNDPPSFEYQQLENTEFLYGLFSIYPKIRPHYLNQIVNLCMLYLTNEEFKNKLLEKAINTCPTLVHRLFKLNAFTSEEIKKAIDMSNKKYLHLFFKNQIPEIENINEDFDDEISICHDEIFTEEDESYLKYQDDADLIQLIENGFHLSSIEYFLKYDHVDQVKEENIDVSKENYYSWCPFEWANRPNGLDYLSVSAYFGSIKCFNYFILSGCTKSFMPVIDIIAGGSNEILKHVSSQLSKSDDHLNEAAKYCRYHLIELLIKEGADVNNINDMKRSPLQIVSKSGHLSVVELLLTNGADINSDYYDLFVNTMDGLHFILHLFMDI